MIKLSMTESIPSGYAEFMNTSGIPVMINIDNNITCRFLDIFDKEYIANIDLNFKEDFLKFPVIIVGGDIIANFHANIDLINSGSNSYYIRNLEYFSVTDGWKCMVKNGQFEIPECEPDPDWL